MNAIPTVALFGSFGMFDWLIDLARNPTALWTIAVGAAGNAGCAILGCYLVLRRLSLLGDAISHAVLPGIVVAFLLSGHFAGWPMLIGALAVGMLTTLLTETLHGAGKVPEDASMGVVFTSLFAAGVILITAAASRVDLDPGCVLYGLIEFTPLDTVDWFGWDVPRAFQSLSLALVCTLLFVSLLWKELKLAAFDPELATAVGINAQAMHYLLMGMVAVVTVASFEAVGSILVVAMLIVPAATAHLMSDRLGWMMVWAVGVAVVSAVAGYAIAAHPAINSSVAGMMAVAAGGQFSLAVFFAPRHGLLSKVFHNLSLSLRIASEDVLAVLYRAEELATAGQAVEPWRRPALRPHSGGGFISWLALWRLGRRHQVAPAPAGAVELTESGRREAQSIVRSHRLWEAYLERHFDLPLDHLHEPAERLEHYIGPELQELLAEQLKTPAADPHGREIPPAADAESRSS